MEEFLINNAVLMAIIVISGGLLLAPKLTAGKAPKEVDNNQATELINSKQAQIVDIRLESDFKAGNIAGSKSFPATEIHKRLGELDKKKPVVLVSAAGDAKMALGLLRGMGFLSVQTLKGGIKAWREAGLPLVR